MESCNVISHHLVLEWLATGTLGEETVTTATVSRQSPNPHRRSLFISTQLRLDLAQVMSSLSMIMSESKSLITLGNIGAAQAKKSGGGLHLAPGAPWRRVQTKPKNIVLGQMIGHGSYSKVHVGTFQKRKVAVKIFRNTSEESAFKEIEIMFALRHPNIIGLYAWFQIKGGWRGRSTSPFATRD